MDDEIKNAYWIIPIHIDSDIKKEVEIEEGFNLLPLSDEFRNKLMHKVKFFSHPNFSDLLYSNFYFKVLNSKIEIWEIDGFLTLLNITLRLFKFGSSGCICAYRASTRSGQQDSLTSKINGHLGPTKLNVNDIMEFKNFFQQLSIKMYNLGDYKFKSKYVIKDDHLKLMISKYLLATSGLQIPTENRFIDLMTIIEMLYLTQEDEYQLKKKLKSRINKILKIQEEIINDLYEIRSFIVHTGQAKIEKEKVLTNQEFLKFFENLVEITRKSLLLYLIDSKQFEQENLLSLICECPDKEVKTDQIAASLRSSQ